MNNEMKVNFIGLRKICWIISACILAVGILVNVIFGVALDVSFKGGTLLKYTYKGELNIDDATAFFTQQFGGEATTVEATVNAANGEKTMSVSSTVVLDNTKQTAVNNAVAKKFASIGVNPDPAEASSVAPTVGMLFFVKCLVATLIACVFLVIYVTLRFRRIGGFSAALMSVAALAHDLLMVYFAFVIFRIPLNANFVAVMLTILGYSLNDTIVIYDRIRENRRRFGAKADINEVVNVSLNQSFRRTLNTSITTTIVIVTLVVVGLVFQLDAIISFAVPLLFGVVSGFYSSTFLCAPTWAMWVEHRQKKAK